jgi:DNA-binding transcriptional ArsR family regulator
MYKMESFKYNLYLTYFMEDESIFLEYVGDSPRMRILQYLIEGRELDYSLTDLLNAGVSWGTLNNLVPKLFELGMIIKTRKIGRATLYKINQDNIVVKQLIELYDNLLVKGLDMCKEKNGKLCLAKSELPLFKS